MIRSLRKAHAGAALAIAALAIAGCSAHPGTAAFVNGKEITEKQVDRIAAAIDETGSEVPGRAQIVILKMRLVLAKPVLDRASGVLTEDLKSKMRSACSAQYRFVDRRAAACRTSTTSATSPSSRKPTPRAHGRSPAPSRTPGSN